MRVAGPPALGAGIGRLEEEFGSAACARADPTHRNPTACRCTIGHDQHSGRDEQQHGGRYAHQTSAVPGVILSRRGAAREWRPDHEGCAEHRGDWTPILDSGLSVSVRPSEGLGKRPRSRLARTFQGCDQRAGPCAGVHRALPGGRRPSHLALPGFPRHRS